MLKRAFLLAITLGLGCPGVASAHGFRAYASSTRAASTHASWQSRAPIRWRARSMAIASVIRPAALHRYAATGSKGWRLRARHAGSSYANAAPTAGRAAAAFVALAPAGGGLVGRASFYSGGRTASGGVVGAATCAHRSLPFGTRVLVTNLANLRQMVLTVNDRGPFVGGRVMDVSRTAAAALGMLQSGVANIRMQVIGGPG